MRESLQDQLLKAGFTKSKPAKKTNNRPKPGNQPGNKPGNKPRPPETRKKAPAPVVSKPIADNQLDKPIKLQIKQLLKENKLNNKEAEIPYNYVICAQIKRCYVTEAQLKQLSSSELAIVNWNDRSYLIPVSIVELLQSLHPNLSLFVNSSSEIDVTKNEAYEEHPIPDDLTW